MENEELIAKYFSRELTPEQEKMFNTRLASDASFKDEVTFYERIKEASKNERSNALKDKLQDFEKKAQEKEYRKTQKFPFLKIAIVAIVLFSLGYWMYSTRTSIDTEQLYASNFKIYPNTVYALTRSDTVNSPEREAFVAYENGDYELAFTKMNQATPQPYSRFFKAQTLITLDRFEDAKAELETTIQDQKQFVAEAHWYLALVQLKQNRIIEAQTTLQKLVTNYIYKKEEAQELLKKLD